MGWGQRVKLVLQKQITISLIPLALAPRPAWTIKWYMKKTLINFSKRNKASAAGLQKRLDKPQQICFNISVVRIWQVAVEKFFKKRLDKSVKILLEYLCSKWSYEEVKINFQLLFPKQEKSKGEISLSENLTAMCEWAIWNDCAARQNSSKLIS